MAPDVCTQAQHDAIKADRAAFDALEYRGVMPDELDDGTPAQLVLRNCTCGSTIAVQVPAVPEWLGILRDGGCL